MAPSKFEGFLPDLEKISDYADNAIWELGLIAAHPIRIMWMPIKNQQGGFGEIRVHPNSRID